MAMWLITNPDRPGVPDHCRTSMNARPATEVKPIATIPDTTQRATAPPTAQNTVARSSTGRHDQRVHDWPGHAVGGVPSPTLVAAWLTLDMLPTERIPRWAASWIVDGFDGPALIELAGLHGDDSRDVRDLLPAALADCGVTPPITDAAAAMEALTNLAQLYVDGEVSERWIVDKVTEILARTGYSNDVIELPLGQLYGMDDEWGAGWGRGDAELRAVTREACVDQLRLGATN